MRRKIRTYRITVQFLVFVALNMGLVIGFYGFPPPTFYCHGCPFASTLCPLGAIQYAVIVAPLLLVYILGVLTLFASIFGRAPCGWACPIGALQDLAGLKTKYKRSAFMDRAKMRWFKYAVLVSIFLLPIIFHDKVFCDICPIGGLTATVPTLILMPGLAPMEPFFMVKMILTVLFLVLIILVTRGWCKYFCPLGAYLSVFNKVSLVTIKFDGSKCLNCTISLCKASCPMNIDPMKDIDSVECIRCGRCVYACPSGALKFGIRYSLNPVDLKLTLRERDVND